MHTNESLTIKLAYVLEMKHQDSKKHLLCRCFRVTRLLNALFSVFRVASGKILSSTDLLFKNPNFSLLNTKSFKICPLTPLPASTIPNQFFLHDAGLVSGTYTCTHIPDTCRSTLKTIWPHEHMDFHDNVPRSFSAGSWVLNPVSLIAMTAWLCSENTHLPKICILSI